MDEQNYYDLQNIKSSKKALEIVEMFDNTFSFSDLKNTLSKVEKLFSQSCFVKKESDDFRIENENLKRCIQLSIDNINVFCS